MSEPHWLGVARKYIGTTEVLGPKHNAVIIGWAQKIGGWIASFYTKDEIPWCGLFVANCMRECGYPVPQTALSARSWAKYGDKISPRVGSIMVFTRSGGGHVGFYVAEDRDAYHILGGNQSNSVNIARVAKNRFLDSRWPPGAPAATTTTVTVSNQGSNYKTNFNSGSSSGLSTNEA